MHLASMRQWELVMSLNLGRTASAFALSCVLCLSSTAAVAASRYAPQSVNPLATISIFGSPAAATALCGNAAVAAAGAAAAQAAPGCVLPVVDPAPPPPIAEPVALPPPPLPPAAGGIGLLPILLGVAGLIGLALLIASQDDDDDDDDVPVSAP